MASKQIGKVVQCIGAVVDVEFPRDQMPKVFDALIIDDKDSPFTKKLQTLKIYHLLLTYLKQVLR